YKQLIIMKKPFLKLVIFYVVTLFSFTSCLTKDEDPNPNPDTETEVNTVSGKVVDAQGKPLAGVKVRAENPTGYNVHVEGTTNAEGKYKLTLTSVGSWKIYAWKEVEYKSKMYHLRLGMPNDQDYDAFTVNEKGAIKNFVWKLSGRIPDRGADVKNGFGYFGGSLRFVNANGVVPAMAPGTKVTITLAPVTGAHYLDGTLATATGIIHKIFTITNEVDQNYYMGDIPVTEYHVSIESERNGVKRQVYLGKDYSELYAWLELYLDPVSGSSGSYESGIQTPTDFPYYMGQKD
ncbi:MAG: carboxypeptidase-like regulatory domain-containing protein, partial [Bacteroidota bacterium]|nr:carboxypeptidase-like regulatory domain-containing protein [Bacteroidota bacterium]